MLWPISPHPCACRLSVESINLEPLAGLTALIPAAEDRPRRRCLEPFIVAPRLLGNIERLFVLELVFGGKNASAPLEV